uniref:Uncharacterized protein n=1 Tax=Strigamia maritima TaxID=126957 RepID=T1J605_STRMM
MLPHRRGCEMLAIPVGALTMKTTINKPSSHTKKCQDRQLLLGGTFRTDSSHLVNNSALEKVTFMLISKLIITCLSCDKLHPHPAINIEDAKQRADKRVKERGSECIIIRNHGDKDVKEKREIGVISTAVNGQASERHMCNFHLPERDKRKCGESRIRASCNVKAVLGFWLLKSKIHFRKSQGHIPLPKLTVCNFATVMEPLDIQKFENSVKLMRTKQNLTKFLFFKGHSGYLQGKIVTTSDPGKFRFVLEELREKIDNLKIEYHIADLLLVATINLKGFCIRRGENVNKLSGLSPLKMNRYITVPLLTEVMDFYRKCISTNQEGAVSSALNRDCKRRPSSSFSGERGVARDVGFAYRRGMNKEENVQDET